MDATQLSNLSCNFGAMKCGNYHNNLVRHSRWPSIATPIATFVATERCIVATRVAMFLRCNGPGFAMFIWCNARAVAPLVPVALLVPLHRSSHCTVCPIAPFIPLHRLSRCTVCPVAPFVPLHCSSRCTVCLLHRSIALQCLSRCNSFHALHCIY